MKLHKAYYMCWQAARKRQNTIWCKFCSINNAMILFRMFIMPLHIKYISFAGSITKYAQNYMININYCGNMECNYMSARVLSHIALGTVVFVL